MRGLLTLVVVTRLAALLGPGKRRKKPKSQDGGGVTSRINPWLNAALHVAAVLMGLALIGLVILTSPNWPEMVGLTALIIAGPALHVLGSRSAGTWDLRDMVRGYIFRLGFWSALIMAGLLLLGYDELLTAVPRLRELLQE